jgi:hypothetical protein
MNPCHPSEDLEEVTGETQSKINNCLDGFGHFLSEMKS